MGDAPESRSKHIVGFAKHWAAVLLAVVLGLGSAFAQAADAPPAAWTPPSSLSDEQALTYIASYGDLIAAYGTNVAAARQHYTAYGKAEGRVISFDANAYLASNPDVARAFGSDKVQATRHYITNGFAEGRSSGDFDVWRYLASYGDLLKAFGADTVSALQHYVSNGFAEGRKLAFDAMAYIASYGDLIRAFGTDVAAATRHFVTNGFAEGRAVAFNATQYLANYGDLAAAFGNDLTAATAHFVRYGAAEGRTDAAPSTAPMSTRDAYRLADQASFGATEALIAEIRGQGAAKWVQSQMALASSHYTLGNGDAVDKNVSTTTNFCDQQPYASNPNCWRDWVSSTPLAWDFYRNATQQSDQLRQRVAFALQQIVVVNNIEVEGTYGFRLYYNNLLDNALGNYRQVLKKVALSPVMGDFLNNVNNDKAAPNENFGRELLQLFSLGTCLLNADGSLQGGNCAPTYDNDTVRAYAYALTGWTYPVGGASGWGCWPQGANCRYLGGDMAPIQRYHDTEARTLLSNVGVPAGSTAPQALELVLDSLMQHPNMAPFIGKQLIQHLVTANPSRAYVQRVAAAFVAGRHTSGGTTFGAGQRGDLAATVAAVLLDAEARGDAPARTAGKLREPVLMFTAMLRGLNGRSDGDALTWWWGDSLRQHVFRPPSVFNFYPPDYPMPGTGLAGPAFALHNASSALERLNFLTYLLYWGGSQAEASVPAAFGTRVDTTPFEADAADAAKLVDRLSVVATGAALPTGTRNAIVTAVNSFTAANNGSWKSERVKQAAYLVYATPNFQAER